jgi:phosphate-selective porin OprO/OprP
VPENGFYVMSTYLLTGEKRTTYSEPIVPLRNLNPNCPCACPGAWELFARVSSLELGDSVFQTTKVGNKVVGPLANPLLWSRGATELTLGFNWYLNKFVRVQFNYEHDWFQEPVQLGVGPSGRIDHQDALLTRLQLIF